MAPNKLIRKSAIVSNLSVVSVDLVDFRFYRYFVDRTGRRGPGNIFLIFSLETNCF